MKKSFIDLVKMNEAPLQSFDVLPNKAKLPGPSDKLSHSSSGGNFKRDIQTAISKPFQKTLNTKMKDIPYPIYIYQMAIDKGDYDSRLKSSLLKYQMKSDNPDYYHMIDRNALAELYGEKIASMIKLDPAGVTLVYGNRTAFPSTVWSFLHDFVHTITISEKTSVRKLEVVERILSSVMQNAEKFIIKKNNLDDDDLMLDPHQLLTMKSARTGALRDRSEETSTELMTQWLYSKKIEFDWSDISDDEEVDQVFSDLVNEAIPQIETLFWDILMNAKGKAYFTT